MDKYIIGYGLAGGFGGIQNYTVIKANTIEDAEKEAWMMACEEYDSYLGSNGLRDVDEIMEEDGVDLEEAEEILNEERESWIDYEVFLYSEEKEDELSYHHFDNPFKDE